MERTDLLAHESIRDLLGHYTWAGDGGDIDAMVECFAPDGVLDVGEHGGRWEGHEQIRSGLDQVVARAASAEGGPRRAQHHVSSMWIDLDHHDAATVRSYFLVVTDAGLDHWGRYRDRVVENTPGGRWLFAERTVIVDGAAEGSALVPPPPSA